MNENTTLTDAVEQWQRKYRLSKEDPAIAVLELVQLHMQELAKNFGETQPTTFEECRGSIEELNKVSKEFSSLGRDLLQALRKQTTSKPKQKNSIGAWFFALCGVLIGTATGYGLGIGVFW